MQIARSIFMVAWIIVLLFHGQDCHGTVKLYNHQGDIKTPSFPNEYPTNEMKTWYIRAPTYNYIRLKFKEFQLGINCSNCTDCDTLKVYEGSTLRGVFCGNNSPTVLESHGSSMTLIFKSDNISDGSEGFWISYQMINLPITNSVVPTTAPDSSGYTLRLGLFLGVLGASIIVTCLLVKRGRWCADSICSRRPTRDEPTGEDNNDYYNDEDDEEFQRAMAPPPTYEEASRQSVPNVHTQQPRQSVTDTGMTRGEPAASVDDNSELPSYSEALRISALSLERTTGI